MEKAKKKMTVTIPPFVVDELLALIVFIGFGNATTTDHCYADNEIADCPK